MNVAIGKITAKKSVYCSVCRCAHKRIVNVKIFSKDEVEIEMAKQKATKRINKEYICRICTSIIRSV